MSLVPILLIGFWGAFYLRDAVGLLAAPGTGLDFRYQGEEGVLHLTADSYLVQVRSGKVTLNNPRVQRSDGGLLATANLVRIEGISLAGPSPISVIVRDLDAELVRLPSGEFEFQSYLPAAKEPTGESAFRADIYNFKVRFIDLAGPELFEQLVLSDHLTVEGAGDNWIAGGTVNLPNVGQAALTIQNSPTTGMTVEGSTPGLQLAHSLRHFRQAPEADILAFMEGVDARSIEVSGPLRIVIPREGNALIETTVHAEAEDLTVRDFGQVDSAVFTGLVTQAGARGELTVLKQGGAANFEGTIDWTEGIDLAGNARSNVASREVLPVPLRDLLPDNLRFRNAEAAGYVSLVNGQDITFRGDVSAQSATIEGQALQNLSANVAATPKSLLATNARARFRGIPVRGTVSYNLESQALRGLLLAENVNLADLDLTADLTGQADVRAIIEGTSAKPVVEFIAVGDGSFRVPNSQTALAGDFRGRGVYRDGFVTLTAGRLETDQGVAVVGGTTTPEGKLDLQVAARGIDLSAFSPDLQGTGAFSGRLVGTFSDPQLQGRAQVTNLVAADQEVPILVADITANKDILRAQSVQAIRGAATASGRLAYRYSDGRLWGQAQALALPLPEFSDGLLGQLDIRNAILGGTISDPVVSADVGGSVIVPGGLRISNAEGNLRFENNIATIPSFEALLAGGSVSGNARYEVGSKTARIEFNAESLNLDDLTAQLAEASVMGQVGAEGAVVFHDGVLRYGKATGSLNDVTVNGTLIGSGPWSVNVDPTNITASSQLGTLERYIELEQFAMSRQSERAEGILTAYQIPIQDVYRALDRYIPDPKTQPEMQVRNLDGVLDARVAFNGPLRDPNIEAQVLEASELTLGGRDLGRLVATVAKQGESWKIDRVNWDSDAGTLRASGIVDETGSIRLDGDLSNFDLSLLSLFENELQRLSGRASVAFAAEGPASSPSIMASLDARQTVVNAGEGGVEFGLVLDTLQLTQSSLDASGNLVGGIEAQGRLFYQGIEGIIQAHVPLAFPFEIPQGQPLTASLTVPQRNLQDLAHYFPGLSEEGTSGHVAGQLTASGYMGNIDLGGSIRATADQLSLSGLRTKFTNVSADATITSGDLRLNARTGSDRGGAAVLQTTVSMGDLGERLHDLAARGLPALLERPASGQLELADFRIDEPFGGDGLIAGTANGTLTAGGTLGSPLIEGTVQVADSRFRMPGEELISGEEVVYLLNPRFGLTVRLTDPMNFSTGTAELDLIGSGTLEGSLTNPDLNAALRVESGLLRLPTARVRIEQGGSLNIRYTVGDTGDLVARADVNLEGRTQVVDAQYGELPQRYSVTLDITGNLLSEDEARIQASSEPPGLSQERILALLGEADLITGLVGGAGDLETQQRLRDALTGFAVPAVLDPLTARLAQGLGLDYLAVSYDPYSRFTVNFARPLGNNLVLEGRRQLSEPLPGLEPEYELKLTYRLPVRSRTFRRIAISFGTDQLRPWKLEVSYSFRFR